MLRHYVRKRNTTSNRGLTMIGKSTALHDYQVCYSYTNNSSIVFYRKTRKKYLHLLNIITLDGYLFGTDLRSHYSQFK